jgi:hypothetical protein
VRIEKGEHLNGYLQIRTEEYMKGYVLVKEVEYQLTIDQLALEYLTLHHHFPKHINDPHTL